nr:aldose 1-epimerase [Diplocloster modestus]
MRCVSLENNLIRVGILLDKGADIFEYIYKPQDVDFMFRSPLPFAKGAIPTTANPAGNFMDFYEGGWQVMFPGISTGGCVCGAALGMHGEAALLAWDMEVVRDEAAEISVRLEVRTMRFPFRLSRTLKLRENDCTLYIEEQVVNEGRQEISYQWGQHPALGGSFLDDSCEICVDGYPAFQAVQADLGPACCLAPGQRGIWPAATGRDKKDVDLSAVHSMDSREYREFGLSELKEGAFEVLNHRRQLGFGMKWDKEVFPYIWVWQMYGGGAGYPFYGRAYTLALEMWNSLPGGLENAVAAGTAPSLKEGESIRTSYEVFVRDYK